MRLWVKIGLFFSAYFPLFLILAIKNWFNLYATILFVFATVYSFVWSVIFFISIKGTSERYKILKIENQAQESLNYLVPYVISFIGFDLSKWQDLSSLAILLIILFVIYLNSNLLFINPMLLFFKYKIYKAEICNPIIDCQNAQYEILLITKKHININEEVILKDIEDDNNVYLGLDN